MYARHFAFARLPFENDLVTDQLFESDAHLEAEARLKHLVEVRGIGLLTGEVGAGKTTGNVLDMYKSIGWELGLPTERSRATA